MEIPKKGSVSFAPSADMGSSTTSTARKGTNLEETISSTERETSTARKELKRILHHNGFIKK